MKTSHRRETYQKNLIHKSRRIYIPFTKAQCISDDTYDGQDNNPRTLALSSFVKLDVLKKYNIHYHVVTQTKVALPEAQDYMNFVDIVNGLVLKHFHQIRDFFLYHAVPYLTIVKLMERGENPILDGLLHSYIKARIDKELKQEDSTYVKALVKGLINMGIMDSRFIRERDADPCLMVLDIWFNAGASLEDCQRLVEPLVNIPNHVLAFGLDSIMAYCDDISYPKNYEVDAVLPEFDL